MPHSYYNQFEQTSQGDPTFKELPIFHTMEGKIFTSIIYNTSRELAPAYCKNFQIDLLYFFYGRPSYRVKTETPTADQGLFPVVILINPKITSELPLHNMYPFDTGGFGEKMYDSFIDTNSYKVQEFAMPKNTDLRCHVEFYYSSNQDYIDDKAKSDISCISPHNFHQQNYYRLISSEMNSPFDERRSCIELQCNRPVTLNHGIVNAVVMPVTWLDADEICDVIVEEWEADIIPYSFDGSRPIPKELSNEARKETIRYMQDQKWI